MLGYGQSRMCGFSADAALVTTAPPGVFAFSPDDDTPAPWSPRIAEVTSTPAVRKNIRRLVPAVEVAYKLRKLAFGETGMVAMASIYRDWGLKNAAPVVVSTAARPGYSYAQLKRRTQPYGWLLMAARGLTEHAETQNLTPRVDFIPFVQGEGDRLDTAVEYAAKLAELAEHLNEDIKRITGQTEDIPLLVDQIDTRVDERISAVAYAQLEQGLFNDRVVCVGPSSQQRRPDGVHFSAEGYLERALAFAYAASYRARTGQKFTPLRVREAKRSGSKVTLFFDGDGVTWPLKLPSQLVFNQLGIILEPLAGGPPVRIARSSLILPDRCVLRLETDPHGPLTILIGGGYADGCSITDAGALVHPITENRMWHYASIQRIVTDR